MPLSSSILAYGDCRKVLDQALDSPKGVRVTRETPGKALNFVHRCNRFRVLDRIDNAKKYPEDSEWHGVSVYDGLTLLRDGAVITIVKSENRAMEVEVL